MIGSLLASHTLLGFPIVQRLGLTRDEAVTVTVGATIFTDIASLMVLAVCIPIHVAGFSTARFCSSSCNSPCTCRSSSSGWAR